MTGGDHPLAPALAALLLPYVCEFSPIDRQEQALAAARMVLQGREREYREWEASRRR